jgi:hypothetical protein
MEQVLQNFSNSEINFKFEKEYLIGAFHCGLSNLNKNVSELGK